MNPQIIKSYASNDTEASKRMTLKSTVISFDLMLIMGMPFIFTMDTVLCLWLKEVPEQAVLFTQLAVFSQIINTISSSTYIAFVSSGKLQSNAVWALITGVAFFIILYVIYRLGGSALWVQYLYVFFGILGIVVLRPWLLKKDVGYSIGEVMRCNWDCIKVLIPVMVLSFVIKYLAGSNLMSQVGVFIGVGVISVTFSYLFMDKSMKNLIKESVRSRLKRF